MAYRLKLKETLSESVRRIACEQIDAVSAGPASPANHATWVHDTRKSLKRLRAMLRLVRSGLGDKRWASENAALARIGRGLSGMRDSHVLVETLSALAASDEEGLAEAASWFWTTVAARSEETAEPSQGNGRIAEAIAALAEARARLSEIDVEGNAASVIANGIRVTHRRGRGALDQLADAPSDVNEHELRKVVQTAHRQYRLVQAAWPELYMMRAETAKALGEILGRAQDLALLASAAAGRDVTSGQRHLRERIVDAARTQQRDLAASALPVALRLFALKPKAAGLELAACWRAAMGA